MNRVINYYEEEIMYEHDVSRLEASELIKIALMDTNIGKQILKFVSAEIQGGKTK